MCQMHESEKRRLLFDDFFFSQFNSCQLFNILHAKELDYQRNYLHAKGLTLTHQVFFNI